MFTQLEHSSDPMNFPRTDKENKNSFKWDFRHFDTQQLKRSSTQVVSLALEDHKIIP